MLQERLAVKHTTDVRQRLIRLGVTQIWTRDVSQVAAANRGHTMLLTPSSDYKNDFLSSMHQDRL